MFKKFYIILMLFLILILISICLFFKPKYKLEYIKSLKNIPWKIISLDKDYFAINYLKHVTIKKGNPLIGKVIKQINGKYYDFFYDHKKQQLILITPRTKKGKELRFDVFSHFYILHKFPYYKQFYCSLSLNDCIIEYYDKNFNLKNQLKIDNIYYNKAYFKNGILIVKGGNKVYFIKAGEFIYESETTVHSEYVNTIEDKFIFYDNRKLKLYIYSDTKTKVIGKVIDYYFNNEEKALYFIDKNYNLFCFDGEKIVFKGIKSVFNMYEKIQQILFSSNDFCILNVSKNKKVNIVFYSFEKKKILNTFENNFIGKISPVIKKYANNILYMDTFVFCVFSEELYRLKYKFVKMPGEITDWYISNIFETNDKLFYFNEYYLIIYNKINGNIEKYNLWLNFAKYFPIYKRRYKYSFMPYVIGGNIYFIRINNTKNDDIILYNLIKD